MEIKGPKGPSKTEKAGKKSGAKKSATAGAAFQSFLEGGDDKVDANSSLSSSAGATPIDAILALQGVDPEEARKGARARAAQKGFDILKILDDIQVGILMGEISGTRLIALQRLIDEQRENFDDPHLSDLLDDIELRAAIELAKLER